jgi:hypothetical protein
MLECGRCSANALDQELLAKGRKRSCCLLRDGHILVVIVDANGNLHNFGMYDRCILRKPPLDHRRVCNLSVDRGVLYFNVRASSHKHNRMH